MRSCRFCGAELKHLFMDLGSSPLANAYLTADQLSLPESFYPLNTYVCDQCFLVQLGSTVAPELLFKDYAYFSSYSSSWLKHAAQYVDDMCNRFHLNASWQVCEVGSNDGYLLKYFMEKNIPVLGIEPAGNVAKHANEQGILTQEMFFNQKNAKLLINQGYRADLLIGNNVLAHVPDVNDFVSALRLFLSYRGIATFEFPHLKALIDQNEFDTIYHEHFSYFSLFTANKIFEHHGLVIFDAELLPTHGGSLRIYVKQGTNKVQAVTPAVSEILRKEKESGLNNINTYLNFSFKASQVKQHLLEFLVDVKQSGKLVLGYGAPAKGNTLLNYCGVNTDFLHFTVDRNPHKQGHYLPGTHIPVLSPEKIFEEKPDYLLVLPWNLKEEVMQDMKNIRNWGGRFVFPIPDVQVV